MGRRFVWAIWKPRPENSGDDRKRAETLVSAGPYRPFKPAVPCILHRISPLRSEGERSNCLSPRLRPFLREDNVAKRLARRKGVNPRLLRLLTFLGCRTSQAVELSRPTKPRTTSRLKWAPRDHVPRIVTDDGSRESRPDDFIFCGWAYVWGTETEGGYP